MSGGAPAGGGPGADPARKRLRMRAWRRGTREMDLILGPFADARLAAMSAPELAAFDSLLGENDQDLYLWVTGAEAAPDALAPLMAEIAAHAGDRLRGSASRDASGQG